MIVAIKQLLNVGRQNMTSGQFLKEASTMQNLEHPNIVKLYGVCCEREPILIVTEYMDRGSLEYCIKKYQGNLFKIKELGIIAEQIACGMSYLEAKNIVHRDLRTANVLVNSQLEIRVADFGLARLMDIGGVHTIGEGSVFPCLWTAPEARGSGEFTSKSDVYSFGCLLYEMITYGKKPEDDMNAEVVSRTKPEGWSKEYFDIMKECLASEPDERPTFAQLETKFQQFNLSQ